MPDIYHSLLGHDLGHLRIVAELWGIELRSKELPVATKELAAALLDPAGLTDLIASLPSPAREAVGALTESNGRIPYATFIRRFGDIREMGPGRRDRERPHLQPSSTSEVLYYRALIAEAFFDTDQGPQEFAYIPDDLLALIQSTRPGLRTASKKDPALGRAATAGEKAHLIPATDRILDDATTLLAALRLGLEIPADPKLLALLHLAGLLKKNIPQTEAVRKFLGASRPEALNMLGAAWQESETFNELRFMPAIICEGEWKNPARETRNALFGFLATVPANTWWSLNALVSAIKQTKPDFQRPAGDYDSWFIRRAADGSYLRGFAAWDEVDGALIRFFIADILHWLGRVELASPAEGKEVTAFRMPAPDPRLSASYSKSNTESGRLKISSNGKIAAPRSTPRPVRYQLARFCEWDEEQAEEYKYRITPHSLKRAGGHGLNVAHLLTLLAKNSEAGIPPALVKALQRWEANGTEARAETQIVLKVGRPEVLAELRKSKAARFLGEPLGPTTITVRRGAIQKVMEAMTELGFLAEDLTEEK
ncbi:MAG TPA: helicase-associated domain-containing protein [Anaerolineales bacterium]|nr:helicase-associated domain-containing protein [Anaerolineales bacterium]